MKNKKLYILGLIILLTFTGCSINISNTTDDNSNSNTSNTTVSKKSKGNCTLFECMELIEPSNTVEEINEIIGITGELTNEQYNEYSWKLSDNETLISTYYSSDKGTIKAEFDKSEIKNSKVNITNVDELKTKVNSGITYDDFKTYMGGEEGTLIEKSTISNKYIWVDNNENYINATFSLNTGLCTYFNGYVK